MSNIIVNALEYKASIPKSTNVNFTTKIVDLMPIAQVDNIDMKFNVLAYFDKSTKTFTWSWYLNINPRLYTKTKKLLQYSVDKPIVTLADAYVRRLLLTPQFINIESHIFDTLLSIGLYLTKANIYGTYDDGNLITYMSFYS